MRDKKIYRTDEVSRESSKKSDWLRSFADSLAKEEGIVKSASAKTAVEVMRSREKQPSVYEMMSAIVSPNKPKFSSVEEVVKHYQTKTGLHDHINRTKSEIAKAASAIKAASADGDVSDVRWNPDKERLESMSGGDDSKPVLIVKIPKIESYVDNMIDTNHGIQLPALLHSIIETFSRDGADQSACQDKSFMKWLNDRMISKHRNNYVDVSSDIGRGVGTKIDYSGEIDSNRDPFVLLVPSGK